MQRATARDRCTAKKFFGQHRLRAGALQFDDAHGALPSPWKWGDIGWVGSHGLVGYSSATQNTFHLTASGVDIWTAQDYQGYIYQAMDGDCSIVAHVTSRGELAISDPIVTAQKASWSQGNR